MLKFNSIKILATIGLSGLVLAGCGNQKKATDTSASSQVTSSKVSSNSSNKDASSQKTTSNSASIDYESFFNQPVPKWSKQQVSDVEAKIQKQYGSGINYRIQKASTAKGRKALLYGKADDNKDHALSYLVINYVSSSFYKNFGAKQLQMFHDVMLKKGENGGNFTKSAADYAFKNVPVNVKQLYAYSHHQFSGLPWKDSYLTHPKQASADLQKYVIQKSEQQAKEKANK